MAVAYDASAESHTGTTASTSEASFSWTHTPSGTPAGVLVYVFTVGSATAKATSVTYGGSSLAAVTGGEATDTDTELFNTQAWFLGSSVPTGAQTVVVNRTNDSVSVYAISVTVTAASDTEVYEAGIVLEQENQTLAEENVDDGSPGSNSVRFIGITFGAASVPPPGSNTTPLLSIDYGGQTSSVARETTAGQGSRPVGLSAGTADDTAAVYLAVREVVGATVSLYATADGTLTTLVDEADLTTNIYTSIDDDPASANDADWVNNGVASGTGFFDLTNMPGTFETADSATIVARYRGQNFGSGTVTLYAQLYQSDETTSLSNEVQVAQVTGNGSFADTSAVTITGINTSANKTVWDGARVRFRWATT